MTSAKQHSPTATLDPDGPPEWARLAAARAEFDAEVTYLNTATLGLPPRRSWLALQEALASWRAGNADPVALDAPLAAARDAFAGLTGVPVSAVAVGSQVSAFAGLIAAGLPDGSEVLTAAGDFTSILFPFHAQAGRGVVVRDVPLERIADAVTARTTLVSVSAVQSADGRIADLDALHAACEATATRILLDTTHAVGWLPVDARRFAYTVCAGYKWLLAPRGTAYLTIRPELMDELVPHQAGWYAGAERWASIYGAPLRLASDARRFDVSPAWHSWVAAAPALGLLAEVGTPALHANAVRLANRFRFGVGLDEGPSAIVSLSVDADAAEAMRVARIAASMRAGHLRLSFHVSTSEQDVDRAVEVLHRHVVTAT
jgi:selenocysteine lyase/cysteine desulfurase